MNGTSRPTFADLNGDGDLDAFVGTVNGNTFFFENTGSSNAPAFAPFIMNPFGLQGVGLDAAPTFADLNGDGLLDAFIGNRDGNTVFFNNTGTSNAPAFDTPSTNPLGLSDVGGNSNPTFADLDGDGDLDAFIGRSDGETVFFENIACGTSTCVEVSLALWLEGPWNNTDMNTDMNTDLSSVLPETDPYFGTESVTPGFFTSDPTGQQVVDWIWIELRTGDPQNPPMTTVAQTAALLMSDGSVKASDGVSAPVLAVDPEAYYVVVGHRNHVPAMTASPLDCSSGSCSVDFRASATTAFGGSTGLADLGAGAYGLLAGDGTGNGQVQNDDKNVVWASQAGQAGYRAGDFNLNAEVQNDDKNSVWSANAGKGTQVPASTGAMAQGYRLK